MSLSVNFFNIECSKALIMSHEVLMPGSDDDNEDPFTDDDDD